jgi:hypothetical protein
MKYSRSTYLAVIDYGADKPVFLPRYVDIPDCNMINLTAIIDSSLNLTVKPGECAIALPLIQSIVLCVPLLKVPNVRVLGSVQGALSIPRLVLIDRVSWIATVKRI